MTVEIQFKTPDLISTGGITSDSIQVTFWSNELIQSENGLRVEEGQSLKKNIIQQVNATYEEDLNRIGFSTGISVAVVVGGGILLCEIFGFDQTPFWLFFNVWQMFLHLPLLNLKLPGYISTTWRS